jgi:hypothetical protein
MKRPWVVAVADTLMALAVAAWVGGHAALGAFAARIVFRDLPRPMASSTMTTVFRSFDSVILIALTVLIAAAIVRVINGGLATRADRIVAGAALALGSLGLFEIVYVHPHIEQMFEAGRTLEPAFASLHKLSERSGHMEVLLMGILFAAQAFSRKRA